MQKMTRRSRAAVLLVSGIAVVGGLFGATASADAATNCKVVIHKGDPVPMYLNGQWVTLPAPHDVEQCQFD